jgi:hypothetical protein
LSPEKDKNFQWLQLEAVPTSNILPRSLKEYLLATMLDRETAHYTFSDSTRAQPSDAQPSDAK